MDNFKVKTAVMWACFSIIHLFANIMLKKLEISVPVSFQSMSTATDLFWVLFPILMVVLTLFLKDAGSRWTNIVVGLIFLLSNIAYLIFFIISTSIPLIITVLLGLVLLVLITISAIRWSKYRQVVPTK